MQEENNNELKILESTEDFINLLSSKQYEKIDLSIKLLWIKTFKNAHEDRESSRELFDKAMINFKHSTTEHATIGQTLTKYLERSTKANDQIIELCKMVDLKLKDNEEDSDEIDLPSDEMYKKIKSKRETK